MPEQPLRGLILRLVGGFIVLFVLGVIVFIHFRQPQQNNSMPQSVTKSTPTPQSVTTPLLPTPTPSQIQSGKKNVVGTSTKPEETVIIQSNPQVIINIYPGVNYHITPGSSVKVEKQ